MATHDGQMVFARVHPPRPLEPMVLEAALLRLASDPTDAPVTFEARSQPAEDGGASVVEYWLGTTAEHGRWLYRTLRDLVPGLIIEPSPAGSRQAAATAAHVKVQPPGLALLVDQPEATARALLSALAQPLQRGEVLVLQVVFGRRRTPRHRRAALPDLTQSWWHAAATGVREAAAPMARQHDTRALQAGMATCIRFGVTATSSERRRRLLVGLLGGLSTAKSPSTFLSLVRDSATHLNAGRPPSGGSFAPAAAELVGLLGWPLGDKELPGLPALHPKLLPPSRRLAKATEVERVIGVSNVPGRPTSIGLSASDNLYHLIATGPTGSGKSTALLHLIRADAHAGRSVLVIDPKRQLIDDIVASAVPEERIHDVVLLDPSDERAPGLNPLDVGDRDPDVVVDGLLAVFAEVFAEGWGPRTQDITHAGLLSLARAGKRLEVPFTLLDLPRLFTDPNFRRSVTGHVADDPALGPFWASWEALSPQAQTAALAAPSNKWRQYLMRPSVRRILGQPQPQFRLRDVFRAGKIVLVPLNEALVGPITARLLGGLIVAETWAATLERAAEHHLTRRPASVWIDEVQNYLHLPTSLDDALNASRSMGVSWNLAHQFRAQMPPGMLAAVDSNARTKLVFRPSDPKDATAYARMAPELDALDFQSLGHYEAYSTVVLDGEQQPWCSVRTLPPPEPTGLADRIRQASRDNYGVTPPVQAASTDDVTDVTTGASSEAPVIGRRKRRRS